MKNLLLGEYEKRDIQVQVTKVLRGLGNPSPPLKLEDVRALLDLDVRYYRSGDDSAVQEFVSKVRIGLKQIVIRPTLLWDVIKRAELSALWVPDRRRILVDANEPLLKHRWFETHETLHSLIPWHQQFMLGDTLKELSPSCLEVIESEANYGAGQLLFFQELFVTMARSLPVSLESIRLIAKHFGNTITSTLWRYVEEVWADTPVVALTSVHPHYLAQAEDPMQPCQRCIESPAFKQQFGGVGENDIFARLQSYCTYGKRGPIGTGEIIFTDVNGDSHYFCFESFATKYHVQTLGVYSRKLATAVGF